MATSRDMTEVDMLVTFDCGSFERLGELSGLASAVRGAGRVVEEVLVAVRAALAEAR